MRARLKRLDHGAIFVLIAGTYTPLCLVALGGVVGTAMLVSVWLGAIAGVVLAAIGIAERRLVEQTVARDLGEAFVFLADVKNALEVDRRVHAEAVPAAPDEQTALARRLGYEEYPRQAFIDDYLRITRRCRRAMERVFQEELA